MTHDELVQFAAEKVGWVLRGGNDHTKPLHKKSKDFPGTWIEDWDNKGPHPRWEGPDGELVYLCGCDKSTHGMPDISSPDLFFEGLAVYAKEGAPFQISWWGVKLGFQNMTFDGIEDIPMKFWECWAEVEGANNLTKEGV